MRLTRAQDVPARNVERLFTASCRSSVAHHVERNNLRMFHHRHENQSYLLKVSWANRLTLSRFSIYGMIQAIVAECLRATRAGACNLQHLDFAGVSGKEQPAVCPCWWLDRAKGPQCMAVATALVCGRCWAECGWSLPVSSCAGCHHFCGWGEGRQARLIETCLHVQMGQQVWSIDTKMACV